STCRALLDDWVKKAKAIATTTMRAVTSTRVWRCFANSSRKFLIWSSEYSITPFLSRAGRASRRRPRTCEGTQRPCVTLVEHAVPRLDGEEPEKLVSRLGLGHALLHQLGPPEEADLLEGEILVARVHELDGAPHLARRQDQEPALFPRLAHDGFLRRLLG